MSPARVVAPTKVNFGRSNFIERATGERLRDAPVGQHLRVVAHASEQSVGDARGAARAPRDLARARRLYLHVQNLRRAVDDDLQILLRIKIEVEDDAEAPAQRCGDESGARRRAD